MTSDSHRGRFDPTSAVEKPEDASMPPPMFVLARSVADADLPGLVRTGRHENRRHRSSIRKSLEALGPTKTFMLGDPVQSAKDVMEPNPSRITRTTPS